jgi:hypothetical protein
VGIAVFIIVDATQFNIFNDVNPRPWTFQNSPQKNNVVAPSEVAVAEDKGDGLNTIAYSSQN